MKIHFLGTAASEGIPNPFCRCEHCLEARRLGGKDIRTQSSAIIDDLMLVDMSPTFSYQLLRDGRDATEIEMLLFTHTHPDHFNVGDLYSRMEGYGYEICHPLHIFGNDRAINGSVSVLPGYTKERFGFHCLVPYETIEHNGYKITPLLANHAKWEYCFVYHIEKNGQVIFYGHDSGWFPELTWNWLINKPLDIVVLECTYGLNGNDRTDNHMSLETVFAAKEKLTNQGCIHEKTQVLVSHISHSARLLHTDLETVCAEYNILVASDGLTVTCP